MRAHYSICMVGKPGEVSVNEASSSAIEDRQESFVGRRLQVAALRTGKSACPPHSLEHWHSCLSLRENRVMPVRDDTYATRRHLPHLQKSERTYFVTFVTRARQPLPPTARNTILTTSCYEHE